MAINPMIPLSAQTPDLVSSLLGGYNLGQTIRNAPAVRDMYKENLALAQEQRKGLESENQKKLEDWQLRDMAVDALQVMPMLARGDVERADAYMSARTKKVLARGGDPSDTLDLQARLRAGEITPQQAAEELGELVTGLRNAGVLQGAGNDKFALTPAIDAQGNPVLIQGSRDGGLTNVTAQQGFRPFQPTVDERTAAEIEAARQKAGIAVGEAGGKRQAELTVDASLRPVVESRVEEAKGQARQKVDRSGSIIKAISDEKEVGRILDLAEPLLERATASLAGAAIDQAGRVIGISTEGSRAASQLKTLEGALIMKMPRMEGPQSNMDQQLYRQMAAQIGDPTIPADQRKAAMDTLRELNRRYSGQIENASQDEVFEIEGVQIKRVR